MDKNEQESPESKQEQLDKIKLSKTITSWAGKNRNVFWKYEVSCFRKTYILRITNLPEPSVKDIQIAANNRLLNEQQRKQLCDALTKTYAGIKVFSASSIEARIDYDGNTVIAEII